MGRAHLGALDSAVHRRAVLWRRCAAWGFRPFEAAAAKAERRSAVAIAVVIISLKEYETSAPVPLSIEQRDALRALVPDLRIEVAPGESTSYLLTPRSHIGAVALDNLAIEITPKLSVQRVLFLL